MTATTTSPRAQDGADGDASGSSRDLGAGDSRADEREITWLELFYDLVFVATLVQLGSSLSRDLNWMGVVEFALVFALLWWVWAGTALFFNRFPADDVPRRLLTFAQIFFIGNLAVVVGYGFDEATWLFALFYGAARLVLAVLYLSAAKSTPEAAPTVQTHAVGYGAAALVWLASAAVPEPWRFALWGAALVLDVATGVRAHRGAESELPLSLSRLSERYGQLTLIVLGEAFIKTVGAAAEGGVRAAGLLFGFYALAATASAWWASFGDLAGTKVPKTRARLWSYGHLPLTLGIVATGVGMEKVVVLDWGDPFQPAARALAYGALALTFAAIAALNLIVVQRDGLDGRKAALGRAVPVALLGLAWWLAEPLPASADAGLAVAAVALPVALFAVFAPREHAPARVELHDEAETASNDKNEEAVG